jgi:hypothetical protein
VAVCTVLVLAAGGAALFFSTRGGDDPAPKASPTHPAPPPPASASASPTPSEPAELPYVVLKPGTCFIHPNLTKGLSKVTVRPCTKVHDGEAIANVTLKGKLKNDAQIANAVRKQCTAAATLKARRQEEGSRFYSFVLSPTVELYRKGYDQVTCTLTASRTVGGKKLHAKLR